MKTKESLPSRVYVSKKDGKAYPINLDGSAIDMDNPIDVYDLRKYLRAYRYEGANNHFIVYELK